MGGIAATVAVSNAIAATSKPVVFWFYGSVADSIKDCPFPADQFQIHSVDIPCHGADVRPGEPAGLEGWRYRLDRHEALLNQFLQKCSATLDTIAAPTAIVGGVSRGAFAAMHLSARDPRFQRIVALSPVTDLRKLTEFNGYTGDVLPLDVDALSKRRLLIAMQSQDDRVSTSSAINLVSRIADGKRPADVRLLIEPGDQHTVTEVARSEAVRWVNRSE
ncbi:hypothetical protein AC629_41380 [Bradyrhizobium sp. NAS80.1]|uniref:alpha/beta hydrolase n=1 Tax=Bradyrhizobium sp. NAS80.1 TaxID=1680159 RepID=UPI00095CC395|nr:hypothetical protein [Bradyrhizobium sp. NAS80.1]OKO69290.1 hypothetical protein AC629_41380 [Bradyrhizobium sp. NAS80.1]